MRAKSHSLALISFKLFYFKYELYYTKSTRPFTSSNTALAIELDT